MREEPSRVFSNVLGFETHGAAIAYLKEHEDLEAEVARLRAALAVIDPWIEHKIGCASWPSPFDGEVEPCNCGLAEAFRAVEGVGGASPGAQAGAGGAVPGATT